MKTALIVLNRLEEHYMAMLASVLGEHRDLRHRFVTTTPGLDNLLRQRNLAAHYVGSGWEEGMYDRFDGMDRLSAGPMLDGMVLPGARLPVSHTIFWDRLSQWFNFRRSDHSLDLAEAFEFDLLVAPLDIEDGFSQSMMREAKRRGVPSVGIKAGFLRTKENIDAHWCFDRVLVDSPGDMRFLVEHGKAAPGSVTVIPDQGRAGLVRQLAGNGPALAAEARRRLGIAPDRRIHAVIFCKRHAWECRRLLRGLAEARRSGVPAVRGAELVVQYEGPQEAVDFPLLFEKEIRELRPVLAEPAGNAYHLAMAAEAVIFFRFHPILEDVDKAGRRAILYDPHRFNRSHLMGLAGTGIELRTEGDFDWSALGGPG
jgi:hypothetical protein